MKVTSQTIKQTISIIIITIRMIQMNELTCFLILYFYGNTLCLLFLSKCVYRLSYRCQTFNPLPLQSKTLPWVVCVWLISLFFMILFTVILIMIIIIIIMLVINIFIVMTLNLSYLLHKPDSLTSNIYTFVST